MKEKEFVVFAMFSGGKKKYITGMVTRADNQLMPTNYSEDIAAAKKYTTVTAVKTAISRINNIHDRVFEYEPKNQ